MDENWMEIESFRGYSISDWGRVRNDVTGRNLVACINQQGIAYVGLRRGQTQFNRSIAPLVAEAFLPPSPFPSFDTPINLDGDRTNNHISNLMWRPRWFAMKYHHQFSRYREVKPTPVKDMSSGEEFNDIWEVVVKYGLLFMDIYYMVSNIHWLHSSEVAWPTGQQFRLLNKTHIIPHAKRSI